MSRSKKSKEVSHADRCLVCGAPAMELFTCLGGEGDCIRGQFLSLCTAHSNAMCIGCDVPMAKVYTTAPEVATLLGLPVNEVPAGTVALRDHSGELRISFSPEVTAELHKSGLYGEVVDALVGA